MKRQARPGPNRGKKKPKEMPKRPLSAYNLYFQTERKALIERYEKGDSQPDFDANIETAVQNGKDKDKGAVFQAASRTLAERWKNMTPQEREPYERQADEKLKAYRKQVAEYQQKRESQRDAEDYSSSSAAEVPMSSVDITQPLPSVDVPQPNIQIPSFAASAAAAPVASATPVPTITAAQHATPQSAATLGSSPQITQALLSHLLGAQLLGAQPLGSQQQFELAQDANTQNLANAAVLLNNIVGAVSNAQNLADLLFQAQGTQVSALSNHLNTGQIQGTNLTSSIIQTLLSWQSGQQNPHSGISTGKSLQNKF